MPFLTPEEEKPLTTCQKCKSRPCIKTQKICDKVERLLTKVGIHSANWIRPQVSKEQWRKDGLGRWREIPFSMLADINPDSDKLMQDNSL